MTRYLVQLGYQKFLKGYELLSFAKNTGRNIGKNLNKNLVVNTVRNLLIMQNSLLQIDLKLLQMEQFRKWQKQLVI